MNNVAINDLCRLTVVSPENDQADVAVPLTLSVAELVAAVVRGHQQKHSQGTDGARRWVLQRVGEEPFDDDETPESLGIRDGEILYLRPFEAVLPPIGFDDVVDGVSKAITVRPDRWRPAFTRWLFLGLGLAGLGAVLVLLMVDGPAPLRALTAGAAALVLACGAAVCARALGDGRAAILLGVTAPWFAALAGLLAPNAASLAGAASAAGAAAGEPATGASLFSGGWIGGANVLCAGLTGLAAAAIGMVGVGLARPLFLGVGGALAGMTLAGSLAVSGLSAVQAAATMAAVAFALSLFAPTAVTRLVGIRVPQLPGGAADLDTDIDPVPGPDVVERAALADRSLSALFVATSIVFACCAVALASGSGWAPDALLWVLSAAMLIRARCLVSAWQRVSAVVAGGTGVLANVIDYARAAGPLGWSVVLWAMLLGTGALLAAAGRLPGRRLLPLWGRCADIAETVLAITVVPVLLQVLGTYAWLRGLSG